MLKAIRWQQRFSNLERAYLQLSEAVSMDRYSNLERAGLVKSFEFTFELSWKTLKDYLESEGINVNTPRDVIQQAFAIGILLDPQVWLDALDKRNLLTHTYNEEMAYFAEGLIKNKYFPAIQMLFETLKKKISEPPFGLDLATLELLLDLLLHCPKLDEAKIFGSRALGNAKLGSDVDLCLFGDVSFNDSTRMQAQLQENSPYLWDVVCYNQLDNEKLKQHIVQFGKTIYKRS